MRIFLFFSAFLLPLWPDPATAQDRPPNVVFILADDMGWADLGHDGSRIETPTLDRLALEGVKLTRFYDNAPQCSPTRAALLTGRYPHSVGVPELASPTARGNVPVLALNHDALTIPEALDPAGYSSAIVGKWHLGYERPNWPRTHGFDYFWGSLLGTPGFWEVEDAYRNETPIDVDGYFTDRITDEAIAWIREMKDGPFFLYLAYNAPHYPLEAPARLVYKYRRVFPDDGLFAIYAAMVERMDQGIGRVLDELDRLGIAENTLVMFTSDNGPSPELNSYGYAGAQISAGPLRGHKFSMHEGGIRVPFLARWPGRIPAGSIGDGVALTMDVLPTLVDAAGVRPPAGYETDGVSLMPLLTGGTVTRSGTLHWENQRNMAVRRGDWKLVHQFWEEKPQLYDMRSDPVEQHDLAARHPDIVEELLAAHEAWIRSHYPDPIPRVDVRSSYQFPGP